LTASDRFIISSWWSFIFVQSYRGRTINDCHYGRGSGPRTATNRWSLQWAGWWYWTRRIGMWLRNQGSNRSVGIWSDCPINACCVACGVKLFVALNWTAFHFAAVRLLGWLASFIHSLFLASDWPKDTAKWHPAKVPSNASGDVQRSLFDYRQEAFSWKYIYIVDLG